MKRVVLPLLLLLTLAASAQARREVFPYLDLERYGNLREAERYQLDVADKLFQQEKWKSAQAEYEKSITLYAKSIGTPYAQLRIGECQEYQHFTNNAVKEYQAEIKYFPTAPEAARAAFAIGRCYEQAGDFEKAIEQYDAVYKDYPKASTTGDALWAGADLAERKNLLDRAVEFRRRIVADYPKSERMRDAAYWLARYHLLTEDNVEAARDYARKVLDPAYAERYLGDVLYDQARRGGKDAKKLADKAIERYKNVIAEWPTSRHAHDASRQIIDCYACSDRLGDAIQAAQDHLKRYPADDHARRAVGLALEAAGRWDEARGNWYLQYHNQAQGACEVAESYWRQRKYKETEETYLAVINKYADRAQAVLYRLGHLHLDYTRNYEKAVTYYRQSEYRPPEYLFQVAEAYRRWAKYDEALKTLAEIRGFFPDYAPEAMWRLALVHEQRGKQDDSIAAIALLKKILDVYPRSSQSCNAHDRLKQKYDISYTGGAVEKRE